ncbi:MAG: allantoicase [Acidobacteriota bacterium]|nr:allantoicase [Acidobacteriota bacterium]
MDRGIEHLNNLTREEAEVELLKCCGSAAWAGGLAARRPFRSADELLRAADEVWLGLESDDWLEAFSHHPKIGESKAAGAQSEKERAWSQQEQSGAGEAASRAELSELNREYERKFGYIFIVCATGRSASEILASLKSRLGNDDATEIKSATEEQRQITRLRLRKLLDTLA